MKKQNVRTLTLIVSTFRYVHVIEIIHQLIFNFSFSYLLVGAAIFDALESNTEDLLRKQYQVAEANMLLSYNISQIEYIELEDIVIKYQPHKAGAQWKFPGAFYFSLTVITTIGKKILVLQRNISVRTIKSVVNCLASIEIIFVMFFSVYSFEFPTRLKKKGQEKSYIACQLRRLTISLDFSIY